MELKIATLNCQNNEDNRRNRNDRASLLAHHILEKKYDILGTQELTMRFTRKLDSYLRQYNFYGEFQYGRGIFGTRFPIVKTFNQGNQIVTYLPVSSTRTYALPWLRYSFHDFIRALKKPSIQRRIMTRVEIELPREKVYVFNLHLDYYTPALQEKQLRYVYKKLAKFSKKGKMVLMGDFNLEARAPMMAKFIDQLKELQIERVPVSARTNHSRKTAIDHIFVPSDWRILEQGTISMKELGEITDHDAVYAVVSTNR